MTDRERLQQALTSAQRLSDAHWNLFASACHLMDDQAWTGPTARAFAADQQSRNRDLHNALRDALDLIARKLRQTP